MADVTSICNRALQIIGAPRITAIDDDDPNARSCKACYEARRDALLRQYPWSFAIARAELAADVATPAFGFSFQYQWPSTALRILSPTGERLKNDWVFEGRKILTDDSAPLQVRYIDTITDVATMDPLFREALAADMAYVMAEEITQSNAKQQAAAEVRKEAILLARQTGAIEKGPQYSADDSWVAKRRA